MDKQRFEAQSAEITGAIAGRPLDDRLGSALHRRFPPDGETFQAIRRACEAAIELGWMCNRGKARKATPAPFP